MDATYQITPPGSAYTTILMNPVSYTYTDVSKNTIVASGSAPAPNLPPDFGVVGITIDGDVAIPGNTYQLTLTDGCGQTYIHDYIIPDEPIPSAIGTPVYQACIDSVVGGYRIMTSGFGTGLAIIFTDGPATLGSTKPEFEYTDTYSYPSDTIYPQSSTFWIGNLAVGTYHYTIFDQCGRELNDSITLTPEQVTPLSKSADVVLGCPGENKLFFTLIAGGKVTVKVSILVIKTIS